MSHQALASLAIDIQRRRRITPDDVLACRAAVYADGIVGLPEADALWALDRAVADKAEEWRAFVIEAVTDLIVAHGARPGDVDEAAATWLETHLMADNRIEGRVEFEIILRVLETARAAPPRLLALALGEVKATVLTGEGPAAHGRRHWSRLVDAADVALLRRILSAGAGCGGVAVSRAEADLLFDIHDLAQDESNDPSWTELFVKAIAHHVLGAAGHTPRVRSEALAPETGGGDGSFVARMFGPGVGKAFADFLTGRMFGPSAVDKADAARVAAFQAGAVLEGPEVAWLVERIRRDGRVSDAERALLAFVAAESAVPDDRVTRLLAAA